LRSSIFELHPSSQQAFFRIWNPAALAFIEQKNPKSLRAFRFT
jgi:hypothetical protein